MSIKLFACGDVLSTQEDKNFISDNLKDVIKNSDIAICNFEASLKTINMEAIPKAGPHLYQHKNLVKYLKDVGFDLVSLANNHIYDYGQKALENTICELEEYNIDFVGAGVNFKDTYHTKIIEKNGIKIGILAGCENEFGCLYEKQDRGGYAWLFHYLIEDNIRKLKNDVDVVILLAHAGVENISFPIKEWRDRYKRLCDVGVDVVIGHHPHVPQGYEKYGNSTIFYSLGNFYFDTVSFQNKKDDSYSVELEFEKSGLKNFNIIYHQKVNGQICKVDKVEVDFSFEELNALLNNNFEKRNDDICIELFNKYYYSYYETALRIMPKNISMMQVLKFIIKRVFFKDKSINNRNLLLLHNIKIDSHRFVVQRALSLISEK